MNRRTFISASTAASLGIFIPGKSLSKFATTDSWGRVIGFLVPVIIDKAIDFMYDSFDKNSSAETVVNESIKVVNNYNSGYNDYYNKAIKPMLGSKKLNGQGYKTGNPEMRDKMNGDRKYATTPIHSVRDVKHFDRETWGHYCDNANLQTDDDDGVMVNPTDNRPSEYKGVFYVDSRHTYLIYNPSYYCVGLPIEDPQYMDVTGSFGRKIKEKTGIEPTVDYFYTQRFYFQGDNDCQGLGGNLRTIYWDHGDAVRKYYGLTPLESCGDPSEDCQDGADRKVNRSRRT